MRIINIVDNLEKVNFGIWNAAIATAPILKEKYLVDSELWYPRPSVFPDKEILKGITLKEIDPTQRPTLPTNEDIIIVTHGVWRYPTRWGAAYRADGLPWLYVPHGMLEPWSRKQKPLRKWVYFHLMEKKLGQKANYIRAVGRPEQESLQRWFHKSLLIPNGITVVPFTDKAINSSVINYLFMARLHHKKGVLPMVKAWTTGSLGKMTNRKLFIAGPDQGELSKIKQQISNTGCTNIEITGPLYGQEKNKLLADCHFYLLPSFSEGFPTSVLEAMQNGLIPIITKGCNFPEVLERNLAICTYPCEKAIQSALQETLSISESQRAQWSLQAWQFVSENYSLDIISQQQHNLYLKMLEEKISGNEGTK
jgi:glycosyltransferase involved in cell wall biosynthesis